MSILGSTAHHAMHEALSAMRFHAEDKRVSRALKKRSDAKAASINRCILATCCTSWALVLVKERKVMMRICEWRHAVAPDKISHLSIPKPQSLCPEPNSRFQTLDPQPQSLSPEPNSRFQVRTD